jgi:hypothetical protein
MRGGIAGGLGPIGRSVLASIRLEWDRYLDAGPAGLAAPLAPATRGTLLFSDKLSQFSTPLGISTIPGETAGVGLEMSGDVGDVHFLPGRSHLIIQVEPGSRHPLAFERLVDTRETAPLR